MRSVYILTDNLFKYDEIAQMVTLYGCKPIHKPYGFILPHGEIPPAAFLREETSLRTLTNGDVEHQSTVQINYPPLLSECDAEGTSLLASAAALSTMPPPMPNLTHKEEWTERVRGVLRQDIPLRDDAYHWDTQFFPKGSQFSLQELKEKNLKVSARQRAVGAWLAHWLHYDTPVTWKHMTPEVDVFSWLSKQKFLQSPHCQSTKAIIERTARGGAWFKASSNRRIKHYWWPGLNAGVPMTPKSDYVHELTFLVHDLVHWAMPDVLPSGQSLKDYRLYVVTRMMSEALTLVHADMVFIHQALQAGLEYDTNKRHIYPVYNPYYDTKSWCRAMAHYAILGDDSALKQMSKTSEALDLFKQKYGVFFEEDLRWTAHNAEHLIQSVNPQWGELFKTFSKACDLHLTTTEDYYDCWSDNDSQLVNQVFDKLWETHWGSSEQDHYPSTTSAEVRRLQRWWFGQLALTYSMNDLPLSQCVRDTIVAACLNTTQSQSEKAASLQSLIPLWDNYVDSLEGLCRISSNDTTLAKTYYPVTPPMYVSYDKDRLTYQGIAKRWDQHRDMNRELTPRFLNVQTPPDLHPLHDENPPQMRDM